MADVSQDVGIAYEAQQRVWQDRVALLEAKGAAIQSIAFPVEAKGLVLADILLPYEAKKDFSLELTWDILQRYYSPLGLSWIVVSTLLRSTLPLTWSVKETTFGLPLSWRVFDPQMVTLYNENVQVPYGRVTKTP